MGRQWLAPTLMVIGVLITLASLWGSDDLDMPSLLVGLGLGIAATGIVWRLTRDNAEDRRDHARHQVER